MTHVNTGVGSAAACETMGQVQLDGSAVIHGSPTATQRVLFSAITRKQRGNGHLISLLIAV